MSKEVERIHGEIIMNTGVYTITNIISNRQYVGSTSQSFNKRFNTHKRRLLLGNHHSIKLQRAFNKHGKDSFIFQIIEECDPEYCIKREQFWMDKLKPFYNTSKFADSTRGTTLSEKHKQKLKDSQNEPELKKRMSLIRKKLWEDPDYRKLVLANSKKSLGIKVKKYKIWLSNPKNREYLSERIREACKHRDMSQYKNNILPKSAIENARKRHIRNYHFLSPQGEDCVAETIYGFSKEHGLDSAAMNRITKGKYSQHKGWRFSYKEF